MNAVLDVNKGRHVNLPINAKHVTPYTKHKVCPQESLVVQGQNLLKVMLKVLIKKEQNTCPLLGHTLQYLRSSHAERSSTSKPDWLHRPEAFQSTPNDLPAQLLILAHQKIQSLTQRAESALWTALLGSKNWCSDSAFEKHGQGLPGAATPDATVMRLSSSHCTALMLQYVI